MRSSLKNVNSWCGCKLVQPLWKAVSKFLKKLKIELPYDPARASLVAQTVKNLPAMQENQALSLGGEDLLKKEMTTHSSILAWRIPWIEEPGGLQSRELQRVGHD